MTLPYPASPSPSLPGQRGTRSDVQAGPASPTPAPTCAGCGSPDLAAGWVREASARELASLAADPSCPSVVAEDLDPRADRPPTTVPVAACADCALPPELAARAHAASCQAPPRDPACPACPACSSPA